MVFSSNLMWCQSWQSSYKVSIYNFFIYFLSIGTFSIDWHDWHQYMFLYIFLDWWQSWHSLHKVSINCFIYFSFIETFVINWHECHHQKYIFTTRFIIDCHECHPWTIHWRKKLLQEVWIVLQSQSGNQSSRLCSAFLEALFLQSVIEICCTSDVLTTC